VAIDQLGEASTVAVAADYGDVRSGMRVIFEGVDDGKDALATVAGLGHAILTKTGFRIGGWA